MKELQPIRARRNHRRKFLRSECQQDVAVCPVRQHEPFAENCRGRLSHSYAPVAPVPVNFVSGVLDLVDHINPSSLIPEDTEIISHLHAHGAAQIHENYRAYSADLTVDFVVRSWPFSSGRRAKGSKFASWYAGWPSRERRQYRHAASIACNFSSRISLSYIIYI